MSFLIFILVLGVLIFVHELGHFLSAKKFGVRVDEFALGFPPRLFSRRFGGTDYSINAIPIGGYVKIFGEEAESMEKKSFSEGGEAGRKGKKMTDISRLKQAIVLFSGILGNMFFAWFLLSAGFMYGLPTSAGGPFSESISNRNLIITAIMSDSPAEEAGLKAGDKILSVKTGNYFLENPTSKETSDLISSSAEGQQIFVSIERKEGTLEIPILAKEGLVEGKKGIGIAMEFAGILKLPIHKAVLAGGYATWSMTESTITGIYHLLRDTFLGVADLSSITGPVGIAGMVGDASRAGFVNLLLLTVLISINLAVINLLPFPALDGGRLIFLAIEGVFGRPLNAKFSRYANQLGFFILIALMAVITYKDIIKLVQ